MKQKKKLYLAIIIGCILIVAVAGYYGLGGFDPVRVEVSEGVTRTVVGKEHIGKYPPRKIRSFLKEAKALIDSGKMNGQVTLIDYQNDTIGSDSVHYFIGVSLEETGSASPVPSGYERRIFSTPKRYIASITQHSFIRPLPSTIQELMKEQADLEGTALQPYTFDLFYEDGSWVSEGWTK